ncbi:MAG: OmpA family protein [Acidimicrobiales bacterium]
MPSILESVTGLLTESDSFDKLGQLMEGTADQAGMATELAVPAIIGGLADRASGTDGVEVVTAMLDNDHSSVLQDLSQFLNDGVTDTGTGIVGAVFGRELDEVVSGLASEADMSPPMIDKLLPMLAPVVVGVVGERRKDDQLDGPAVAALLAGERTTAGGDPGRPADRKPDGDESDDETDDGQRSALGWLWWAIGAVLLVLLLAWLLSTCSGGAGAGQTGNTLVEVDEPDSDSGSAGQSDGELEAGTEPTVIDLFAREESGEENVRDRTAAEVQSEVNAALLGSGISGTLSGGVVTLTGTVGSDRTVNDAVASVEAIQGVAVVDDQVEVDVDAIAAADADADGDSDGGAAQSSAPEDDPASELAGSTLNELLDLEPVTFDVSSDRITSAGRSVLDEAAEYLLANPTLSVEIGGHTDSDGPDEENLDLSQRRAESVKQYLEDQGVDGDLLEAKGYGEVQPLVPNDSSAAKAQNRRIEFTIL